MPLASQELEALIDRETWMERAACRDRPDVDFFPSESKKVDQKRKIELAKEVCQSCSVRSICWAEAKRRKEPDGIWGGEHFGKTWDGRGQRPTRDRRANRDVIQKLIASSV